MKKLASILALMMVIAFATAPSPPLISVTGAVYNSAGAPAPGTAVTFNSLTAQATGGVEVAPTMFTAIADATGAIAVQMPRGLRVSIVIGKSAPVVVTLPDQPSIDLSDLLAAIQVPPPVNLVSSLAVTLGGDYMLGVVNPVARGSATLTPGNVTRLNGNPISATAPSPGQFLLENAAANSWVPGSVGGDATASTSVPGQLTVSHWTLSSNANAGNFKLQNVAAGTLNGDALAFGLNRLNDLAAATGNYAMGSNKLTGLGAGSASGDTLAYGQSGAVLQSLTASVSSVIDPTAPPYNAVCDGTTDDGTALNSALAAAAGKALRLPGRTCATSQELQYDAANGPIAIIGSGPNSILKLIGTSNKGVHIIGSAGATPNPVLLRDFQVGSATSGTSAAGVHLDGIAHFLVDGVWVAGNNKMANCFELSASQQGEIAGGQAFNCATSILQESCPGNGGLTAPCTRSGVAGTVRSNGVEIHGMTINPSPGGTGWLVSSANGGGADDVWFHSNHLTGSAAFLADLSCSGIGLGIVDGNHFEPQGTATADMIVRNGKLSIIQNSFFDSSTTQSLDIVGGAEHQVLDNLINGSVTFDTGVTHSVYAFNKTGSGATFTNNTTDLCSLQNTIFGAGWQVIPESHTASQFSLTSNAASAGDIAVFAPNVGVGGAWGATIKGAGTNDIYLRFGGSGPVVASSTSGGHIKFQSAVGGTVWGKFTSSGLDMQSTGKVFNVAANSATGDALSQGRSHLNDMAAATGNYAMGGNKVTGLGAGSGSGDSLMYGQSAGGDLSGTLPSPTVAKLNGNPVASTAATAGQFLLENSAGTSWVPSSLTGDVSASTSTPGQITVQHFTLNSDASANSHKIIGLAANAAAGDALSQGQSHLNDMAAAAGNYAMGGNKLTGLGAGSGSGDSLMYGQSAGGDLSGTLPSPTVAAIHYAQQSVSSSPYTVATGDSFISCNASGGVITVNLPAASGSGRQLILKKVDSSANACTFAAYGTDTIDGAAGLAVGAQYAIAKIVDRASGSWARVNFPGLGGDLSGYLPNPSVARLNGNPVASTAPTAGQFLLENAAGTSWAPFSLSGDVSASTSTPGQITVQHFTLNSDASANSHKITGLAANAATGDALSQGQSHLNDLAAATGNYAMGGNKLTGLGAGSASGDSFAYGLNTINQTGAPTADFSMNSHKLTGVAAATAAGDALSNGTVPFFWRYFGDGSLGAVTDSLSAGEMDVTTFTCSSSLTATNNEPLIIRATQSITLNSGCAIDHSGANAGNNVNSGDTGGSGGGGGGGTAAGTVGTAVNPQAIAAYNFMGGGAAGASSGGSGGNGSSMAGVSGTVKAALINNLLWCEGAGKGGAGGSSGGAGGKGGGCVILIAPTVTINSGATITVAGAAGTAAPGNNTGGGGGGGGGFIGIAGVTVSNSGTLTTSAGTGGGCGSFTGCGAGGNGGAGWTKTFTIQ